MSQRAVVPDASVAVKWFMEEPGTAAALELRRDPNLRFQVPDLWYLELANATWKRARRDPRFTPEALAVCQSPVLDVPVAVLPSSELFGRALAIALEAGISFNDAAYAAATERAQATLVTADAVLHRRLRDWRPDFPVELLSF